MGQNNEKEKVDRARDLMDYDQKKLTMLNDAYQIGINSMSQARALTDKGISKGAAGWMHLAEKAIGEIVRLTSILSPSMHLQPNQEDDYGVNFGLPKFDETLVQ